MGGDVEIPHAGPVGQGEGDRGLLAALPATGFENVGNGPRAERVAGERLRDGGGELGRAVVVEQPEQTGGVRAERFAARRSKTWPIAGTASRSRSRPVDGLAWRVAASKPSRWARSSMVWPVS
jgi:hypothetical protein